MHDAELVLLGLLVAVPSLSLLARVLRVPYPIVLALGGLGLGLIPGVPRIELDPQLVLVLFLPPLLYVAAFFANQRELRADTRAISLSSIGLVLLTTAAVAVVARALIDGLPWAAAFALGAIVSPTDPIAATAIFHRLGAPRRLTALVEGESLLNDSTALIAYRVAVTAAVGGAFSLLDATVGFIVAVVGGIAVGLAVAWPIGEIRRRIDDPPVEITISLFTGYAAYLPAEQLGVSGVLAAVTAGLYLGWRAPGFTSATMRIQGTAVWEFVQYLANAVLFVLIGLQLPRFLEGVQGTPPVTLVASAAAVCGVVVGARVLWLFTVPYLVRALDRRPSQVARRVGARPRVVVAWAGLRGAVSVAAALSLPFQVDPGAPFPHRDLLIFLAYSVVLFTVVGQGLTLPTLIRRLGVHDDGGEQREETEARVRAAEAALARLEEVREEEWTTEEAVRRLRDQYAYQQRRFGARAGALPDDGVEQHSLVKQRLARELIRAQRTAIVRLRNEGVISNDVMHRIERELDLEESRLEV
jgi:Na+/H+ antiporter